MGLFSGLMGLAYAQQRELDLEYKIQNIQLKIQQTSAYSVELLTIGDDLDPESPEFKKLNTRREKLQLMEKRLQSELTRYQNQLKVINKQIESYQQIVDASIKRLTSFGGKGGGGY